MQEAAFSFTTKIKGDLLTVRGSTPQEFQENLEALVTDITLGKLIMTLQSVTSSNPGGIK